MRNLIIAGAVGLVLSAPLSAQAAVSDQEVAELKQQVQALMARVQQLEVQNSQLASGAAAAPAEIDQLKTRVAELETTNDKQADQLAQVVAADKSTDWTSNIKWKGDLRYRQETIDEETKSERNRQRIRARIGMEAKVSDSLKTYIGIATGDPEDPRSTNATLGGGNVRKNIALDYAYFDWAAFDNTTVSMGKMKYPFERLSGAQFFYDGDVNPEGGAIRYKADNGLFASGYGFWIAENSSSADPHVFGAQLGWQSGFGLTLAAAYNDYTVKGMQLGIALDSGAPLGGNSFYACGTGGAAACYLYDYNILDLDAEYGFKLASMPVKVWASYIENTAINDLNTGYNVGFMLGKAKDKGSWELGLLYQDLEKDAQWGGVSDSDFAGGITQGKGFVVKGAYVPIKNTSLNLTYFDNTKNYDTASAHDYQRLQLDFSMKF
jgi:regulator of replication initiation timing